MITRANSGNQASPVLMAGDEVDGSDYGISMALLAKQTMRLLLMMLVGLASQEA